MLIHLFHRLSSWLCMNNQDYIKYVTSTYSAAQDHYERYKIEEAE